MARSRMKQSQSKMSRLEAMRAAREQREAAVLRPVVVPLQGRIQSLGMRLARLESELDAMSRVVTSEIAPRIFGDIRDRIADQVQENIFNAMSAVSGLPRDEVITLALLANDVR